MWYDDGGLKFRVPNDEGTIEIDGAKRTGILCQYENGVIAGMFYQDSYSWAFAIPETSYTCNFTAKQLRAIAKKLDSLNEKMQAEFSCGQTMSKEDFE